MTRLSLRTTRWREALVVTAVGELTAETVGDLRDALQRLVSARCVVLDLRSLAAIDAAGCDAIAQAHADVHGDGRELIIVRPHPRVSGWRVPVSKAGSPRIVENIVEAIGEPGAARPGSSRAT